MKKICIGVALMALVMCSGCGAASTGASGGASTEISGDAASISSEISSEDGVELPVIDPFA